MRFCARIAGYERKLKIFGAEFASAKQAAPGAITISTDGILMGAADGSLQLREVQLEGKKRMSSAEFVRGHPWLRHERQATCRPRDGAFSFQSVTFWWMVRPMENEAATPVYKRIVLKLSGEALREAGARENISPQIVRDIAQRIKEVHDLGVQTSVVMGGGNIWRGLSASHRGMDRTTADYMGMLATVINGLALKSALDELGVETRVQTAIEMQNVAEPFILGRAIRHLEVGRVVIFVAGTGNPYFSTDTTAALRASEIRADVILKATKVDGIYDSGPEEEPGRAKRFERITYTEALTQTTAR